MVENPIGDTAGGILRHVHVHGCAAGFDIKADEPRIREPVDLQQVIVILGPSVFAPVVRRLFTQMGGQVRVGENTAMQFSAVGECHGYFS